MARRGAGSNPKNRFEKVGYVPDEPAPLPGTVYLKDSSKSLITYNDSPDVGFEASINPYRGCSHGCVYCMSGDTPILMADGTTRPLQDLKVGDALYGTQRHGGRRVYVRTRVYAKWCVMEPAYRINLHDGTELIASADHRFLTNRGWKFVTGAECGKCQRPFLSTRNKLMGVGAFASAPSIDEDYRRGYLCGLIRGDGLLREYHYQRRQRKDNIYQFRLAMIDIEALRRASQYLQYFGVITQDFLFKAASGNFSEMRGIRSSRRSAYDLIVDLIRWPARPSAGWSKGYLAGIFDSEGSYSNGVIRISNTNTPILENISTCLDRFGFRYVLEDRHQENRLRVIRIRGGLREHLRFLHMTGTAISRKHRIAGQAVRNSAHLKVRAVKPLGVVLPLFDIRTGTGDFIANGVISHNCYARPTHEYLGFSAGLDFESKILVKEDAPRLLRDELLSPRWKPQLLAISGVTDAYQPVEREKQITRRCLQVLAEFRNPVAIVTKNHLVTRDIDILAEMAKFKAAAVFISVTTLDENLSRVMEPRASVPRLRLQTIRELAQAGIPVGVLVAPVVPALTDHEMPSIVDAVTREGAQFAGYVFLRLPYAVSPLFEDWLSRNFPDRKAKVLNRIREIREGRLNDPRFGSRKRGSGIFAEQVEALFRTACQKAGILGRSPDLSTASFRRPQLELF